MLFSFYQGWSEARIKAYLKKDENPNAYYYRFNDIDEPQATGNWNDEEKGAVDCFPSGDAPARSWRFWTIYSCVLRVDHVPAHRLRVGHIFT